MYNELFKKVDAIQTTNTSDLVKKVDCDTKSGATEKKKMLDHTHNKYITTQEFNVAKLKEAACLASERYFADFVKKTNFKKMLRTWQRKTDFVHKR